MVEVLKYGQMEATILETLLMELSKVMVFTFGRTVRATLVNGYLMRCQARETSSGRTVETSKVNLRMELCMVGAFTLGKMDVATKVTTV